MNKMMEKSFLSIDWDYFVIVHKARINSYRETMEDIIGKWYREYLMGLEHDFMIEDDFELGEAYHRFVEEALPQLQFARNCKLILSESHAAAYGEVISAKADTLYLLDAHSDLGYGGLKALDYEVNCANWVGKLLQEGKIKKAYIIYSPYTKERPEEFEEIIQKYDVAFITLEKMLKKKVMWSSVHICRSGPWTPPWYDQMFYTFARAFKLPMIDQVGGARIWQPKMLSLADRINYRLGVI